MKHKILPLTIILLLIGAAGGYWYFNQHPDQLVQLQLRFGLISETEATGVYSVSGFIEAEEVNIAAETSGRIARLTTREGDFVEAGQLLVQLDTALLDSQIEQAKAKIAVAEAQLAKIEAGVRAEEIAKAEAAVAVAEANAAAARTRWQDAITLRDNPQELDMQIDAARTSLKLADLQISQAIPFKDAAETLWELGKHQVTVIEQGFDFKFEIPHERGRVSIPDNIDLLEDLDGAAPGDDIRAHFNFKEGDKRQAYTTWNLAGADQWEAWVNLNGAVATRADAETYLNDLLRLRNDPQTAQLQVTQAEAAYRTALTQVEVAQAQLEILKAGPRPEQIAVAQAQVEQAAASLAALQVQQAKHTLVAPLAGWVVKQVAHEGEMAVPGAPLLTLADLANVTLTVYVPEPDLDKVSPGQQVDVFIDAFPGQPFTGYIIFINDQAEFTPKNVQTKEERATTVFAVKIKLNNEDHRLKPGMPADAILSPGPKL